MKKNFRTKKRRERYAVARPARPTHSAQHRTLTNIVTTEVLLQAVLPRQKRIDENGDAFGRMREVWGKRAVASGNVGGVKSGKAATFTCGLLNVSFSRHYSSTSHDKYSHPHRRMEDARTGPQIHVLLQLGEWPAQHRRNLVGRLRSRPASISV